MLLDVALIDRLANGVWNLHLIIIHNCARNGAADLFHMMFVDRFADGVRYRDLITLHHRLADGITHVLVARFINGPASCIRDRNLIVLVARAIGAITLFTNVVLNNWLAHGVCTLLLVPFGVRLADRRAMLAIVLFVDWLADSITLLFHHRVIDRPIANLRLRFDDRLIADAVPNGRHARLIGTGDRR